MPCLPPLSNFSFWLQWLASLKGKPSLENDLVSNSNSMGLLKRLSDCVQEEGIAEIGVYEEAKIGTIAASYEGDYSASFWLPPRRVGNVSSFCKATVRYDSEAYKVERHGQIPWSAKGSLPVCFFWNEITRVQVSIPYAEAKTLIPDLPALPPNIFAAIFNSLIRR
jgi:hypothetical protein